MKNSTLMLFSFLLFSSTTIRDQNWVNNGNTLSGNGTLGTNSNHSLLFETYNTERGRITNAGLWGIGTTAPSANLHINSTTTQAPLRVQVNSSTKMMVHRNGGVSIGSSTSPPANSLSVSGNVGIGTTSPTYKLHVVAGSSAAAIYGNNPNGDGVYGAGATGIYGESTNSTGSGVYGYNSSTSGGAGVFGRGLHGVVGQSTNGYGVKGTSDNGPGVYGISNYHYGGEFESINRHGLRASTSNELMFAAVFNGSTYSNGSYTGSDKSLKKNIQEVSNAMGIISKLKPKYYEFRDDGQYAALHLPKGTHFGLLAQDVEEVLPNLVKEASHVIRDHKPVATTNPTADEKPSLALADAGLNETKESLTIKAINYTELLPIIIRGMQELQQENIALKERLSKLEAALSSGGTGFHKPATSELIGVDLKQNQPNPFNQITTFHYSIPSGASAQILIHDSASGKLLKILPAPEHGQVQLYANGLKPGTYTYTLMVDGKMIASKHMLVAK